MITISPISQIINNAGVVARALDSDTRIAALMPEPDVHSIAFDPVSGDVEIEYIRDPFDTNAKRNRLANIAEIDAAGITTLFNTIKAENDAAEVNNSNIQKIRYLNDTVERFDEANIARDINGNAVALTAQQITDSISAYDTWWNARIARMDTAKEAIRNRLSKTTQEMEDITLFELLSELAPAQAGPNTTQEDFYRQAVTDMNDALALTDNFITRESEYKKILPAKITGNGNVNAFNFNLADLYKEAKGWREDILQTTVSRFKAIKAGADATAWQAALDDNVFATPTEDAIAQLIDAINNQGDFRNTSDTSDYGAVPVVNSVYQYRLEMIGIVTQELNEFWYNEQANSTMYREAERIRIGNSNGSYLHEQIIGNPQYETWYKNVVDQFSDKMQAIYDATTYEEADTAFATAINYDGPYTADKRPMPITWTDKTVGWTRRTVEATDPYNALVSARAKLVALGLTENEALALASYEGDNKRMIDEWI